MILTTQGASFTVDDDEYDLVALMLAETDGSWPSAVEIIKSLASEYGCAKAVAMVITARREAVVA